uniref:Helicase ATP-binding domain-containing protein n=1 Tax=Steinernema glaseri TaxID=37863 RepID=A0A1I7YN35_9BILA
MNPPSGDPSSLQEQLRFVQRFLEEHRLGQTLEAFEREVHSGALLDPAVESEGGRVQGAESNETTGPSSENGDEAGLSPPMSPLPDVSMQVDDMALNDVDQHEDVQDDVTPPPEAEEDEDQPRPQTPTPEVSPSARTSPSRASSSHEDIDDPPEEEEQDDEARDEPDNEGDREQSPSLIDLARRFMGPDIIADLVKDMERVEPQSAPPEEEVLEVAEKALFVGVHDAALPSTSQKSPAQDAVEAPAQNGDHIEPDRTYPYVHIESDLLVEIKKNTSDLKTQVLAQKAALDFLKKHLPFNQEASVVAKRSISPEIVVSSDSDEHYELSPVKKVDEEDSEEYGAEYIDNLLMESDRYMARLTASRSTTETPEDTADDEPVEEENPMPTRAASSHSTSPGPSNSLSATQNGNAEEEPEDMSEGEEDEDMSEGEEDEVDESAEHGESEEDEDVQPKKRKGREGMGRGGGSTVEPIRYANKTRVTRSQARKVDPEMARLEREHLEALEGLLSDEEESADDGDASEEVVISSDEEESKPASRGRRTNRIQDMEPSTSRKSEEQNDSNEELMESAEDNDSDDDFVKNPKKTARKVTATITLDSDSDSDINKPSTTRGQKRKGAQIVSSDSEAPSSKEDKGARRGRKPRNGKASSKPSAKKVRLRISSASESDGSISSSIESPIKRTVGFSEDEDDDDVIFESEVRPKNARTRRIITNDKLEKTTVDAEKAEKERRKRLEQKQKEFNGIEFSNEQDIMAALSGSQTSARLKSVIVDPDKNGNPPCPVQVHKSLVKILKPHQAKGIQFLYDSAFESLDRLNEPGGGAILAHCMGLGKTLQVISFLHTILMHPKISEVVKRVLVVVPKNVVRNWKNEFEKWLEDNDEELATLNVMELDSFKTNKDRKLALQNWFESESPSVMIIGYEMFRILTQLDSDLPGKNGKAKKKRSHKEEKLLEKCREYLQDPGPDLIVCDEAHKLKNDVSRLTRVMERIKTLRRLCLTGTPLQNNLLEYFVMVNFVKPGLLGTKQEFSNRFKNIIERGSKKDATPSDVKYMKKRCHVLFQKLKGCVDRKDSRVLVEAIPPKQEYVINVRMTPRQCKLYRAFLGQIDSAGIQLSKRVLPDYHILSRIWTHPYQLISHEIVEERKRILRGEDDFIDDGSGVESAESSDDDVTILEDEERGDEGGDEATTSSAVNDALARRSGRLAGREPTPVAETPPEIRGWYTKENLVSDEDKHDYTLGNKLVLLIQIIKKCEEIGDKLLVFSQSLESLELIKQMLEYFGENNRWFVDGHEAIKADGETWSWIEGRDYLVIDGTVNSVKREAVQNQFNNHNDLRARLMLISTRAGSLGTNMVAANRVIIFDACWNPSHDTQSLFRVYRFGQTKPVYIYRFIAQGTMEERIYKRQVAKESTSKRVVDETALQNHFNGHELQELYMFDPDELPEDGEELSQRPNMAPPKDRLLADVILSHHKSLVNYIQHDSLFDHLEDEELSPEEMREAWDDYEHERDAPAMPLTHGVVSEMSNYAQIIQHQQQLQVQQQQQLRQRLNLAPAQRSQIPPNLSVLTQDPLFMACMRIRGGDINNAMQMMYLRNSLNSLIPLIPENVRGGVDNFDGYFLQTAAAVAGPNGTFLDLMARTKNIFNTVIKLCHGVDACLPVIRNLYSRTPQFFTAENARLVRS